MKKLLTLSVILTLLLVLTGCADRGSLKEVSSVEKEKPVKEVVVEEQVDPVEDKEETSGEQESFDPNKYEDEEIDALLGLLEGLVEG